MTVDSSLLTATMHDVAPLIERGELSPVALTEAMLARIAAVDPGIGSYLTVTAELALAQAREAEAAIAGGDYRGPLHGMPIALKDLVNTADIPTTCASPLLRDFRPGYDAAVVERLNAAGAVTLGKLALTEFALYGYHPEFAPPRNPWKTTHWAGVSSSGSGAATAAALCYGCLGTDTGGSIRFPSAACGVVGIKPTFGKVSRYGVFPLADTLDHIGPMARSVADCAAMLAVLEGRDPRDGATRTDPPGDYGTALVAGCQGLRIGIDHAYCTSGTDPVVAQALFDAVDLLAANGAIVVELNAPQLADCAQYWLDVCAVDALIGHRDFYPQHADDYGPAFRALLDHGTTVGATAYARATRERQVTARDQRGHEAHHDDHPDDGHEGRAEADGVLVHGLVATALLLEARELVRFVGEALDGADAAEVDGQPAVQRAHLLTHPRVARDEERLVAKRAEQHERHGQEREDRDRGCEREEHRADDEHRGAHLDELVGARVQEALQLVHVVVEHAHELARAAFLEPRNVERLHVVVQLDAQLVLDGLREVAPGHLEQVLEHRLETPDDDGQQRDDRDDDRDGSAGGAGDLGALRADARVRGFHRPDRRLVAAADPRHLRRPGGRRCLRGRQAGGAVGGRGGVRVGVRARLGAP